MTSDGFNIKNTTVCNISKLWCISASFMNRLLLGESDKALLLHEHLQICIDCVQPPSLT